MYCFGHGLSYTEFVYSDLNIQKKEIALYEEFSVEVTVQNTGNVAGEEVVQLYIRDCYARMARPVKELAGFKRIFLEAGEKKTIAFTMKASQMAFLDRYIVKEDGFVEGKTRGFYAKTEVKA